MKHQFYKLKSDKSTCGGPALTDPLTNVGCAGKGAEVGTEALGAAGGWYGEDIGNWPLLKYVFEQFKIVISNHRSLFKTISFKIQF